MNVEATAITQASAEDVWAIWCDVSGWNMWSPGVSESHLFGPFLKGAHGYLTPRSGPKVSFRLTDVQPCKTFTTVSNLPLARVEVIHQLVPQPEGTLIKYRVRIRGLLSPLFRRLIGNSLTQDLPDAVQSLARLAQTRAAAKAV